MCAGQKRFSRRSKRISKKEQPKKTQNINPVQLRAKPIVAPKPKRQLPPTNHAVVERSISYDDQRLQHKPARKPSRPAPDSDETNRYNSIMVKIIIDNSALIHIFT